MSLSKKELYEALTRAGSILGTPGYIAPETYLNGVTDERSDQFAFAVTLYAALYGVRPFSGRSHAELLSAICSGEPARPRRQLIVPRHIRLAVLRGLSADADARFGSMAEVVRALRSDPGSRWRRAGLVLGVGPVLGAGGHLLGRLGSSREGLCSGGVERFRETWGDVARHQLEQVFQLAGGEYGREQLGRVDRALQGYGTQ